MVRIEAEKAAGLQGQATQSLESLAKKFDVYLKGHRKFLVKFFSKMSCSIALGSISSHL